MALRKTNAGVALVTGASSGIGRAYACKLAAEGYDVVVTARREQRLLELKAQLESQYGVAVYPLVNDISEPDACQKIQAFLKSQNLVVQYLVNNAGYAEVGRYCDKSWEHRMKFIQTMGISMLELTHRLLPGMLESKRGRIVNIASAAAFWSGSPNQTLYTPIKSMMVKFSESIAQEYGDDGIYCMAAIPGFIDTEIWLKQGPQVEALANSKLSKMITMSAETFAEGAYRACEAGRMVAVIGWINKIWTALAAHGPAVIRYKLAKLAVGLEDAS